MIMYVGLILFMQGLCLLLSGFATGDAITTEFTRLYIGFAFDRTAWMVLSGCACSCVGCLLMIRGVCGS
jgi:hypothetical protein